MSKTLPRIMLIQLIFVLGMVFAIPLLLILAAFFIVPAMIVVSRHYSIFLGFGLYLAECVLGFLLNYNVIILVFFPIISLAFVATYFALKQKTYIRGLMISCGTVIMSMCACFLIVGFNTGSIDPKIAICNYIQNSSNDIIIVSLARQNLSKSLPVEDQESKYYGLDIQNVRPSNEPNTETALALNHYAYSIDVYLGRFASELLLQYALALGIAVFLFAYVSIPLKKDLSLLEGKDKELQFFPETIKSFRAVPANQFRQPLSTLTMPKEFFVSVFLPITGLMWLFMNTDLGDVFGIVWSGLCITPYAFAGLTIAFYLIDYIDNPLIINIIKAFVVVVFAFGFLESFILIAFSLFGVADGIIHTRRILEKVLIE